ncbi:MAG: hypothetical protein U1F30_15705 [Steroidobacteraceae bacterium]
MSMWRPPERIRFDARPGRWPTAAEAAASRLFSPVAAGPLALAARTWVPAMVPWRATGDGHVSQHVLDWYRRFALGRPGAIVVEATGIRDVPSGPLLRIGDDRFIPGLARLAEVVREASGGETRLLIQIIDFLAIRRRPDPARFLERFLAITPAHRERLAMPAADDAAVRARLATLAEPELERVLDPREWESLARGHRERVTDMELAHVRELPATLPGLFARAAARARAAGFDGVELHYAHAYTMASFLSATNTRGDGYGGAREQRVRLPREVYQAVRAAVGPGFAVGCRLLADECIEGGSGVDDASYFTTQLAAAGMDFISLSRGGKFDDARQPKVGDAAYPYTGPSGYECMPSYYSDACVTLRPQPRGRGHGPRRGARPASRRRSSPPVACTTGAGRGHAGGRRRRHRRHRTPGAGRSGLVPQGARRPRRRSAPVQVHELLRGARPAPSGRDLRAVGPARARRAGHRQDRRSQAAHRRARLEVGAPRPHS